jgi:pilus assembly protein Flp/PilA
MGTNIGRVFAAADSQIVKLKTPDCGCLSRSVFTVASRTGEHRPLMIALVRKFCADETGATAIEYGLLAAGISLVIIAVVNGIGGKLNTKFTSINTSLK